tara:strand:- start:1143 stop:1535 length:393 start_codon:yes stop_codon:yes gene_type:complete
MAIEATHEWVNPQNIERAYQLAQVMQKQAYKGSAYERKEAESFAERGMRGARSRDHKLLVVLEKATEVLVALSNDQFGTYRQRNDIPESHKVEPTEVQMWREAFKMVDQGTPIENFKWIYGCAIKLAYGL